MCVSVCMCACVYDDACVKWGWAICDAVLTPKQMPAVNVRASSHLFNNAEPKRRFLKHFVVMDVGSIDLICDGNSQMVLTYMLGHKTILVALVSHDSFIMLLNRFPASHLTLIRFYVMLWRSASLDFLTSEWRALFSINKKMSFLFLVPHSILRGPCVITVCFFCFFCQYTVTLQCIKMRLFDELSRCAPLTTQTNIYSGKERWHKGWEERGETEAEKTLFVMLFTVYTSRNLVFLRLCLLECHPLRQRWICPEIIHDLDEGQKERKERKGE